MKKILDKYVRKHCILTGDVIKLQCNNITEFESNINDIFNIRCFNLHYWLINNILNEYCIKYIDGDKEWYLNGQRHREDGPATIRSDGTEIWYFNDRLHRLDGPAVTWSDGREYWYLNGNYHRLDGPAFTSSCGRKHWYINGDCMSKEEYKRKVKE